MTLNRDLFWNLLQPEHPRAEAFCRRLEGSRDDGDDLYQDALLAAMRKFDSLRDREAFRPWLYRIIVNRFKDRRRRPWLSRFLPLTSEVAESVGGDDDAESGFATRRWLERAFKALKPQERALVTLHELEEWTVAELAVLFKCPEGTIKARLSRARRKMHRRLTEYLRRNTITSMSCEDGYALPGSDTSTQ